MMTSFTADAGTPMAKARRRDGAGPNKARVLVVDDHPVIRHGLVSLINRSPDLTVCGEAEDMETALRKFDELSPDVVTVDISLAGPDSGLDLVAAAHAEYKGAKMLVISMMDEQVYAEQALEMGAAGYVQKQEQPPQLLEAIRQVLRGRLFVSPAVRHRLLTRAANRHGDAVTDPISTLSHRERQVFEYIGRGHTTDQIAKKLRISPKTVHTYRQHIMSKLMLENSQQLAVRGAAWLRKRESEQRAVPQAP